MTASRVTPAGTLLREWRQRRRLSQLDLAHLAGTSARHLSYVENGRSLPSRDMVLRLSETLEVPLRDVNQILLGAGHAPAYDDSRTDRVAMRTLLDTLDLVLDTYDPWPALVLDDHFDIVANNAAVGRLLTLIDADLLDPPINVVRVTLHPRGLSQHITNIAQWRAHCCASCVAMLRPRPPPTWTPCWSRSRATRCGRERNSLVDRPLPLP